MLQVLGIAGKLDVTHFTVDIDATLKAGGRKKDISLKRVPLARIKEAAKALQAKQ